MNYIDKQYDLVVCGGGIGGVVTAVTAARKGLKVALVDNKAGLGGNACSEIGVSVDGATFFGYFANMREGGPVEEMKERFAAADPFFHNGQNSTTLLFWCEEAGVEVYSELNLHAVEKDGKRLTRVLGSQGGTERNFRFSAAQFVDATGDGTVAAQAGCSFMSGREAKETFGEILAPDKADSGIMGASLLYRASEKKVPSTYVRPSWAYEYKTNDDLPHRLTMYKGAVECGFWWIEYAGDHDDPIGEYEHIRKELLKCVYGVWAFLKNDPERKMENWALDRVSISPAKRESRRIIGDVVVTEKNIVERTPFPDAISYAGWNIDIHVPGGFKSRLKPNIHAFFPWVFPIPLRALYAKDMDNLWIVGRDMSVSHVALGATRLQATIGAMGHAVGCAAAAAKAHGASAREAAKAHIGEIQQEILKDGSFIPGVRNTDPADLARGAKVTPTNDLPLAFAKSENWLKVSQGLALSFPLVGGRLDRLVLPLKNPGSQTVPLRLFFSRCLHPNHFTDLGALAETNVDLAPGLQETAWSVGLSGLPDGLYAVGIVPKTPGTAVEWMQSATEPYGCYTGLLDPGRYFFPKKDTQENLYAVEKTILVAAEGEDARWVRSNKARLLHLGRSIDRKQVPLPFIATEPVIRPYGGSNVISGISHTDTLPELWVSDPTQALPQDLTLEWDAPKAFSEVRLVFDTDLDMSHPAVLPIECLVKRYRVSAKTAKGWTEVAAVEDNRNRFRIHAFPRLTATALKLTVEEVHAGGQSARVFEIRCYA